MHETPDDVVWLQTLLDASYERAGEHLRSITTHRPPHPRRGTGLLRGVQILDLGTVTAAGEPRIGPVDGLFFRGRFYFGSSRNSLRFRNLRARPQVSAAPTRGEVLAVVVHGRAELFSLHDAGREEFARYAGEVYVPRYGEGWWDFAGDRSIFYAEIDPAAMFTLRMDQPERP